MMRGNAAGPPGLVTRPNARPIVTVEVFIKTESNPASGVGLELFGPTVHRAATGFIL